MIIVKNITKKYKIPHERNSTLFETIFSIFKTNYSYEKIYALNQVSFKVNKGEFLGVIGKNGSGKSTLIKILAGVIKPTNGTAYVKGKITPFMGMGIGFHEELSAKENIFLYGAIIGLKRDQVKRELNTILRFAGVEKFKDTKIKKFSDGMKSRLAFSTLIQANSDILLLDELFAVGDKDFEPECFKIFKEYKKQGKTIILVSHDLELLKEYCDKVLLLDQGKSIKYGKPKEVIEYYLAN